MFTTNDAPATQASQRPICIDSRTGSSAPARASNVATVDTELTSLATMLAVNSNLSVDDFKRLGVARLRELIADSLKAKPVVIANTGRSELDHYDINNPEQISDRAREIMAVNARAATDARSQEILAYNNRCIKGMDERYDINEL